MPQLREQSKRQKKQLQDNNRKKQLQNNNIKETTTKDSNIYNIKRVKYNKKKRKDRSIIDNCDTKQYNRLLSTNFLIFFISNTSLSVLQSSNQIVNQIIVYISICALFILSINLEYCLKKY